MRRADRRHAGRARRRHAGPLIIGPITDAHKKRASRLTGGQPSFPFSRPRPHSLANRTTGTVRRQSGRPHVAVSLLRSRDVCCKIGRNPYIRTSPPHDPQRGDSRGLRRPAGRPAGRVRGPRLRRPAVQHRLRVRRLRRPPRARPTTWPGPRVAGGRAAGAEADRLVLRGHRRRVRRRAQGPARRPRA